MTKNGQVITVMNMKGGVGKTTVSMHLSSIVAHHPIHENVKKVLIIDYDPQFNLSQAFLSVDNFKSSESNKKNILAVLVDDPVDVDLFHIQQPDSEKPPSVNDVKIALFSDKTTGRVFDLVPSTLNLMFLALGRSDQILSVMEKRFSTFIADAKKQYDLIIIDCHPAGSLFTKTAILSSDHLLVPVTPNNYASRGISLMKQFVDSPTFKQNKPQMHILFNHVPDKDQVVEDNIRNNPKFTNKCLTNTMEKNQAYNTLVGGKGYVWQTENAYEAKAYFDMSSIAIELLDKMYQQSEAT